ncbi:Conserved hypothetical protein [Capnocytophaga canimorsus Cc5]|uniref:DUF4136 domain-containing protein n=1 Tax=Capnocytophaga canimorsus (strain 5) TaxID=860228 RepID=F9YPE6_CAPCC|nr:DUF4136 domain-containing protein [Capnocytophaga canimorsus]AEK23340.1 Conserved hypothetical protein [Capnocytophaga canimorsus Cc5]WGU67894.1 DUF4136 domain-containing protein [Capnocytophaga canimorsus]WGU71000.1 DUF4136 domain-containing protein [Capnocytophaga canimorsus]
MKNLSITFLLLFALLFSSCATVQVASDYDRQANFMAYKTYAFHKEGIDKVPISDLDKKRILRAIEQNLNAKGMQKSENPDVLVNIFTKERENLNVVYNDYTSYWGWDWGPFWNGTSYRTTTNIEGTLYIEIIETKNKELIWQGKGIGYIPQRIEQKEKRIQEFVSKILEKYPPKM